MTKLRSLWNPELPLLFHNWTGVSTIGLTTWRFITERALKYRMLSVMSHTHFVMNIPGDHNDLRSESESEVDASKYVPEEHRSVIGLRPSDVTVKLEDITDIRQLETLMRVHVMLAQVAGHSSPHSRDYVLLAYAFLYRIWQVRNVLARSIFCLGLKTKRAGEMICFLVEAGNFVIFSPDKQ